MFTEFGVELHVLIFIFALGGLLGLAGIGTICVMIGVGIAKIIIAVIQWDLRRVRVDDEFERLLDR